MKKLLLTRHAEAASPTKTDDFDRPLTSKGQLQAKELASALIKHDLKPEVWLSSTALRAYTTASVITTVLGIHQIDQHEVIYEASEQTLLSVINHISDDYQFVSITGHNPSISYLFYSLCNEIRDVPPCTALLIEFNADEWAHISAGTGSLKWYWVPTIQ